MRLTASLALVASLAFVGFASATALTAPPEPIPIEKAMPATMPDLYAVPAMTANTPHVGIGTNYDNAIFAGSLGNDNTIGYNAAHAAWRSAPFVGGKTA